MNFNEHTLIDNMKLHPGFRNSILDTGHGQSYKAIRGHNMALMFQPMLKKALVSTIVV